MVVTVNWSSKQDQITFKIAIWVVLIVDLSWHWVVLIAELEKRYTARNTDMW